jgi:acetyl-CoA C-acetyltransferase
MKTIYIVDGARTPFLKARSGPGPFAASDLATQAGRALLLRQPFSPEDLDEVILGCAAPSADETNIGRMVALRLGCGNKVPGWTVMRNCASGMQALDSAIANIQCGRSELVLAGGVDALSRAPLLYSDTMVRWFAGHDVDEDDGQKAGHFLKLRPAMLLTPVVGLMKGLTDPVLGLLMGQTAENLAWKFGIDRRQMDEFAVRSHQRVVAGRAAGHFGEIVPVVDDKGNVYAEDDGVRSDASMAGMAKLKPFFDKKYGNITAANSSQITDGAAWLILASEEAVRSGTSSRSAGSSTASGPASIRLRWGSARCMRRRRSCNGTASGSTISMPGKSTKPSPRRSGLPGEAWKSTIIAASSSVCRAPSARSTKTG